MNKIIMGAVAASALAFATSSHAIPIQVTVTGTIGNSSDSDGTNFGRGTGSGAVSGLSIVQQFTYDTATPVFDRNGGADPDSAFYGTPFSESSLSCSWISASTTIDGMQLVLPVETAAPNAFSNCDGLSIFDKYNPATGQLFKDIFGVSASSENITDGPTGFQLHRGFSAELSIEHFSDFVSGIGLEQEFELTLPVDAFSGGGTVFSSQVLVPTDGTAATVLSSGQFTYFADSVSVRKIVPAVNAPEPGTLALFAAGLLALLVIPRRKAGNLR